MKDGPAYKYGFHNEANKPLQHQLTEHGFDTKGEDGDFGNDTRDAVEAAQQHFNISPPDGVPRADLLSFLGRAATPPPKPTFTIPGISEIGNIIFIFNQVKELQMNTANVDVISAWLSSKNWAAVIAILTNIAALFHIVIPPDLAPTIATAVSAVTALYILVKNTWFTTSVTAASAKKLQ